MQYEEKVIESEFTPQNWALIVWGLMLSGLIFGITPLIAVIIAYVQRNSFARTAYFSHMRRAIFTFWVATVLNLASLSLIAWRAFIFFSENEGPSLSLLPQIGFSMVPLLLVNLWFIIVCVKGLVLAASNAPYRVSLGIF